MKAAAIDLEKLKASAFDGAGETAMVSRAWLQSVYRALSGEPFADVSQADPAAGRQLMILGAIDATIAKGATA